MSQLAYRRILLKLSGEALMGSEDYGIDPKVINRLAHEVIEAQGAGAQVDPGVPRDWFCERIVDVLHTRGPFARSFARALRELLAD